MRHPSSKPSHHEMPPSAAAMRHPLLLPPTRQESVSESGLRHRRRMLIALSTAATAGMSSETRLAVRLRLKLPLNPTLQPASLLNVS